MKTIGKKALWEVPSCYCLPGCLCEIRHPTSISRSAGGTHWVTHPHQALWLMEEPLWLRASPQQEDNTNQAMRATAMKSSEDKTRPSKRSGLCRQNKWERRCCRAAQLFAHCLFPCMETREDMAALMSGTVIETGSLEEHSAPPLASV